MEYTTHLVAKQPGSQKYTTALQHGIHLVKPEWLQQIRQSWVDDVPFDVEEVSRDHLRKEERGLGLGVGGHWFQFTQETRPWKRDGYSEF